MYFIHRVKRVDHWFNRDVNVFGSWYAYRVGSYNFVSKNYNQLIILTDDKKKFDR